VLSHLSKEITSAAVLGGTQSSRRAIEKPIVLRVDKQGKLPGGGDVHTKHCREK
jgi:hypothetical protein